MQVGHAGTLDPMATGLLIVCVGKATKLVDRLVYKPKTASSIDELIECEIIYNVYSPCLFC